MPEERGSIYKSTANEIGEALKAKLGGEGFAPKDWSDNLNLLGIASEDTEAAINSLKESEGSGERGSILLSTANAIGSMLNKKYNSQRGFSPAEWASATRKMKALETYTKNGGIVNLKGAKEVPITSLVGTINPTLEGTDTLVATRNGKNLANFVNGYGIAGNGTIELTATRCATIEPIPIIENVTYKVYVDNNRGFIVAVWNGDTLVRRTASLATGDTLDTSGGDRFYLCIYGAAGVTCNVETDKPRCLTSDDLDTSYTPYVEPTTYTANLGRTIYGGSADIVKGEGIDSGNTFTVVNNTEWDASIRYIGSGNTAYIQINHSPVSNNRWQDLVCSHFTPANIYAGGTAQGIGCYGSQFCIRDSRFTSKQDFMDFLTEQEGLNNPLKITYTVNQPTNFTFDPIPINTSGDTENFYTSNGDTSITYYEEPTPYTKGSASGMIASIPEANTEFPFTKLKATIAPSVEGVSSVVVKNEGKNLFSFEKDQTITRLKTFNLRLFAGSYTFSWDFISTTAETLPVYMQVSFLCEDGTTVYNPVDVIQGRMTRNFTLAKNVTSINIYANTNYTTSDGITTVIENIQLEVGSSATEYTAYKQPTTYTAELGETVFGGSVDLVSGEKVKTHNHVDLGSFQWVYHAQTEQYVAFFDCILPSDSITGNGQVAFDGVTDDYKSIKSSVIALPNQPEYDDMVMALASGSRRFIICDQRYSSAASFKTAVSGKYLTYPIATPTESSIEPQEIYPNEGVNNIWNDANGITEVGYFGE